MSSPAGISQGSSLRSAQQPQGPAMNAGNGEDEYGVSVRPMRRTCYEIDLISWCKN
jgi:hypothetical protein